MKCKSCKHWKSQQAELEYRKSVGICTCNKLEYNSKEGCSVMVLDRLNVGEGKFAARTLENQKYEIPIGQVNRSRYALVTSDSFGCIHHVKDKK